MVRRLQVLLVGLVLVVAAFSTGADFLFFLVYLGLLVVGGAYLATRFGLTELEAGFAADRLHAQVGEQLRVTYTLRNTSRIPKMWLEVHNPSDLPVPLPGRAVVLGPRGERSWISRVPLLRRGQFRIEPLSIRTGDPFGLFESSATVGSPTGVIVYPRVEPLPGWRLPPAALEGPHASPERTQHTSPLATSVRPYAPGDAFSRIHWKSSARQQELQVKEFDLEQTADVWIYLDLQALHHRGVGDESTLEAGVRVAASVAAQALNENRSVGLTAVGLRGMVVPSDRGPRQYQKAMQLLAAVKADSRVPFGEVLVSGIARLRRGMTCIVITPSPERDWLRPLATLRSRGVATVVCLLDALAYEERARRITHAPPLDERTRDDLTRAGRALRHALAEYDLVGYSIVPERPLGELLVSGGTAAATQRRWERSPG